ncbi:hypothetical protein Dimus_027911 [Dionaea muscipula]
MRCFSACLRRRGTNCGSFQGHAINPSDLRLHDKCLQVSRDKMSLGAMNPSLSYSSSYQLMHIILYGVLIFTIEIISTWK